MPLVTVYLSSKENTQNFCETLSMITVIPTYFLVLFYTSSIMAQFCYLTRYIMLVMS